MTDGGAIELQTVAPIEPEIRTEREPRPETGAGEIELRMLELRHRIKNILAVVQSVANQTLRDGVEVAEARQVLAGRLGAIGHAVDLLLSGAWEAAPLGETIRSAMTSGSDNVQVDGPEVRIGSSTAMMLSILFHELECNAIKYGALSTAGGAVMVRWRIECAEPERLVVDWIENGGPPIVSPIEQGFGSTLVAKIAARFDGGAVTEFSRDGLRWRFTASLASLRS